jgi:hypothetical protein
VARYLLSSLDKNELATDGAAWPAELSSTTNGAVLNSGCRSGAARGPTDQNERDRSRSRRRPWSAPIPTGQTNGLLQVAYIVDTNHVSRRIQYRFVPSDVGFAGNVYFPIEGFAFPDGLMALPFGSRTVPIAGEPSSFFTLVATRMYWSPLLTKTADDSDEHAVQRVHSVRCLFFLLYAGVSEVFFSPYQPFDSLGKSIV